MADTRSIHCYCCGVLCMEVAVGSLIRKGAIAMCQDCLGAANVGQGYKSPPKSSYASSDMPDFLKDMLDGKGFKGF